MSTIEGTQPELIVPYTNIRMEPDKVTISAVTENGLHIIRNTNIEAVQQIFLQEQAFETPLLPSQWGVVKYYRRNQYEGYILTLPAMEREVTFDLSSKQIPKNVVVPVPPLLWYFEVLTEKNGNKILTHSMFYVIKHELLSMNQELLHAPFPNLGVSHGVCWGKDAPQAPTAKSLQNIPARFFSQPFNMDLSSHRVPSFTWNDGQNELKTESAVYHMLKMAEDLKKAKEAGETFVYPFDSLKKGSSLTVESAAKTFLPYLFR